MVASVPNLTVREEAIVAAIYISNDLLLSWHGPIIYPRAERLSRFMHFTPALYKLGVFGNQGAWSAPYLFAVIENIHLVLDAGGFRG